MDIAKAHGARTNHELKESCMGDRSIQYYLAVGLGLKERDVNRDIPFFICLLLFLPKIYDLYLMK